MATQSDPESVNFDVSYTYGNYGNTPGQGLTLSHDLGAASTWFDTVSGVEAAVGEFIAQGQWTSWKSGAFRVVGLAPTRMFEDWTAGGLIVILATKGNAVMLTGLSSLVVPSKRALDKKVETWLAYGGRVRAINPSTTYGGIHYFNRWVSAQHIQSGWSTDVCSSDFPAARCCPRSTCPAAP